MQNQIQQHPKPLDHLHGRGPDNCNQKNRSKKGSVKKYSQTKTYNDNATQISADHSSNGSKK